jgi:tRNA1Val (adenine37-N6)-methyltransferase
VTVPTTLDALLAGAVRLEQPAPGHGYRFNVDAVLLAQFAAHAAPSATSLLDLGAGVGAVTLCLAHARGFDSMTLVDSDADVCEIARRNLARAGLSPIATVLERDIALCDPSNTPVAQLVVFNPPYTDERAGRRGRVAAKDRARRGDAAAFVRSAARLLADEASRACMCLPASSLMCALQWIESSGLHPARCVFVHPTRSRPARIVLLEMSREQAAFELQGPLIE